MGGVGVCMWNVDVIHGSSWGGRTGSFNEPTLAVLHCCLDAPPWLFTRQHILTTHRARTNERGSMALTMPPSATTLMSTSRVNTPSSMKSTTSIHSPSI